MANEKRLIDSNKLERLRYTHIVQFWDGKLLKSLPLAEAPTVQAVEVVHGRWEDAYDGDGYVCSVCGADFCVLLHETERFKYCPNCGADMRGDRDG